MLPNFIKSSRIQCNQPETRQDPLGNVTTWRAQLRPLLIASCSYSVLTDLLEEDHGVEPMLSLPPRFCGRFIPKSIE